jgi:hypothetical protein
MENHTNAKRINMMRKRQIQDLMTQDEIIEMAMLEAEFVSHGKPSEEESELFVCTDKDIVRFAKLVAAKEREACAKVCDDDINGFAGAYYLANKIRARGQA